MKVVLWSHGKTLRLLRNKSLSRERKQLTFSLSFIRANMAKEEVTRCVVGNDSGMHEAGFPGDDAPRVVPSDARHGGWYGPEG